ncbi:MAG TPA: MarC family protein [Sporichthyaceae bacterium]|nr:MarC family protein [Sporichthyaceae bacterium]
MLRGVPNAFSVTLLSLFPIMNPIGNLPAFFALTTGDSPARRRAQALRTAGWVVGLLVVFTVLGKELLHGLGVSLPALQIAGGLVVARSAYAMVTNGPRLTEAEHGAGMAAADISFSPMAMPLLAGPGAIGTVIALASRSDGAPAIFGIVLGSVAMGVVVALILITGDPLLSRLGVTGIAALTRIFGFLILAIAVELIAHGVLSLAPGLLRS